MSSIEDITTETLWQSIEPGTDVFQPDVFSQLPEPAFGGDTIPSRLCFGWYFGSERFESEGAFFRGTVDHAAFR